MDTLTKGFYINAQHPDVIDSWLTDVEKLHPRKRDKWNISLRTTKDGVFHRHRFRNGHFQVKVQANHYSDLLYPASGWAPVIKAGEHPTRSQLVDTYGSEVLELRDAIFGGSETFAYIQSPTTRRILDLLQQGASSDVTLAEGRQMIAENHTGNHYRNKTVTVPTAAGQPVRG
jgi:hypothetical protein